MYADLSESALPIATQNWNVLAATIPEELMSYSQLQLLVCSLVCTGNICSLQLDAEFC